MPNSQVPRCAPYSLLVSLEARAKLRDPVRGHDELNRATAFSEHHDACAIRADIVDTAFLEREDSLRLLDSDGTRSRVDVSDEQGAACERRLDVPVVEAASVTRPSRRVTQIHGHMAL